MTWSNDFRSSLERALGGLCPAPRIPGGSRPPELSVNGAVFEKLLAHWQGLVPRPQLRGMFASRTAGSGLSLLLELAPGLPFLLVEVGNDWAPRTITGTWPYAAWWEDELRDNGQLAFPARAKEAGVSWRHA